MVWRDKASSVWGNFTGLSKQCLTSQQPPGQLLWLIAGESKMNRQKGVMNLSSGPDLLRLPVVMSKPFNSRSREFLCHQFFQTEQQNPESGTMAVIKGPESSLFPPHHCCSLCRRHAYSACKLNYFLIIQLRIIWYDSLWKVFPIPFLKLTYKNVQNPTLTSNK